CEALKEQNMADSHVLPEQIALHAAIDSLYSTFASYPLKRIIAGCPHCVSGADSDALHVRALDTLDTLDTLTAQDVRRYATKAMITFGDAEISSTSSRASWNCCHVRWRRGERRRISASTRRS